MKKIIFGLLLVVAVTPLFAQIPPGPHWNLDKFMYIMKGVMVDSNIYPAINHKRSLGLPAGIDVGPRWWRALYVDSIFTNYINVTVVIHGLNRFSIMDSLAKYAESGYLDTFQFKCGVVAGDSHYAGGVRDIILGGRGDTISDGAFWIDSTRNCGILAGENNWIYGGSSSTIEGGQHNWNWAATSEISGGRWNWITPGDSDNAIIGGYMNTLNSGFMTGITTQSVILGGDTNEIYNGIADVILGGGHNALGENSPAWYSGILAGYGDSIDGNWSAIVGGYDNYIAGRGTNDVIDGGTENSLGSATYNSYIAGGDYNVVDGEVSGIICGENDSIITNTDYSLIAGATASVIESDNNVIVGGVYNRVGTAASFSGLYSGQDNFMDTSFCNVIAGGLLDTLHVAMCAGMIGGFDNTLDSGFYSFMGGGMGNYCFRMANGIVGGYYDSIAQNYNGINDYNFMGGGLEDHIDGSGNGVMAGELNRIENTTFSVIEGGQQNVIYGSGQYFGSTECQISGGFGDSIADSWDAVIAGGEWNRIDTCNNAFIGGGMNNMIRLGEGDAICGGYLDTISSYNPADYSWIGAGVRNYIESAKAGIMAGWGNHIENMSDQSTVAGGVNNVIFSSQDCGIYSGIDDSIYAVGYVAGAAILGGYQNKIEQSTALDAVILGGTYNDLQGMGSVIAAGNTDSVWSSFSLTFGSYNKIGDANSINNFAGGANCQVRGITGKDDNFAGGNGGIVDTSLASFAWNTRIYRRDSILAVCKQIWARGANSADTVITTGKGLYGVKIVCAKTDSFAGKIQFQSQYRYALSIPGVTAADVVVATQENNGSDSLKICQLTAWCKADSIIFETWTWDNALGTYKHKTLSDVFQYHVVRKTALNPN